MGSSGITAQAAFVPVSSLPISLPLAAFQVLSTASILTKLNQIDAKLENVENALNEIATMLEAEALSELEASADIVDDVYDQYELMGRFPTICCYGWLSQSGTSKSYSLGTSSCRRWQCRNNRLKNS